jgi:putative spermidine/putrescine transport system permease protein
VDLTSQTTFVHGGRADGAAPAARPEPARARRDLAWVGLIPFFAFLFLFLFVPAISVFSEALREPDGTFGFSAFRTAFSGQNRDAMWFSVRFSATAALVGTFFGTLLAHAAVTLRRPRWLRNAVTSFSGVAANLGGIPLAFAFLALLGRQGVLTKVLNTVGLDIYDLGFGFDTTTGLVVVYSYFNIPLMFLVVLPAVDGLKASWREANANLGGTAFTYWRRVGLPVLLPSIMGGFLLLFANSFSAYATARALTDSSRIIPIRISFYLGGDVSTGQDALGFSLAAWMIIIMAVCMALYWVLRRRAERWQS